MPNYFGKDSELSIKTKVKNGVTILEDSFFTAPLKITKPFYDVTEDTMDIMMMSASAGIMAGDFYKIDMALGPESRVKVYGQSYTKIHRMIEGRAAQSINLVLEKEAFLDFRSQPVIPFADSNFHSTTECHLDQGSRFLYSDILTCGREKRGERFVFNSYQNSIKVYYKGELIFLDRQVLIPDFQFLEGLGFFEGYTHQGTLMFFSDQLDEGQMEKLYDSLNTKQDMEFGLSKTKEHGIIVRILGNSSDGLEKVFDQLRKLLYERI